MRYQAGPGTWSRILYAPPPDFPVRSRPSAAEHAFCAPVPSGAVHHAHARPVACTSGCVRSKRIRTPARPAPVYQVISKGFGSTWFGIELLGRYDLHRVASSRKQIAEQFVSLGRNGKPAELHDGNVGLLRAAELFVRFQQPCRRWRRLPARWRYTACGIPSSGRRRRTSRPARPHNRAVGESALY